MKFYFIYNIYYKYIFIYIKNILLKPKDTHLRKKKNGFTGKIMGR